MIELRNIKKEYKRGTVSSIALNEVSIKFRNKEFVAILGPSGCGKTTLLNIIGGLDTTNSGSLIIDGVESFNFKNSDWDRYRNNDIGFIFQSFNLIPNLTVIENVEMSLKLAGVKRKNRRQKACKALERVGITEFNKLPHQLSGGEQQRVSIARAIVNNPKIILADEPTGALDTKTSIQILDILKEIAKDFLVIMVTHNQELALTYSTRLINLLDGKIISDSNPYDEEIIKKEKKTKKTTLPFLTAIMLSFRNLKSKIMRTILTTIAASIGIIGVGLVLSVSNGVTIYIDDVQRVALGDYPITVSSSVITSPEVSIYNKLEEYPTNDLITIVKGNTKYEHLNTIENEFFEYFDLLDSNLYTLVNYQTRITMNLLYNNGGVYQRVGTTYFTEMTEDDSFVSKQYSVLKGKVPTEANEIALVVDSYNCINALVLYYLGMSYDDIETISFDDILDIELKLLSNDEYYIKIDDRYYTQSRSNFQSLYDNADMTLKVVGILRAEKDATSAIYSSGILYTKKLTDYVYNSALESEIVKEQIENGYSKNVFTGEEFSDIVSLTSTQYVSYQYEANLNTLGAMKQINRFYIYTSKFADRITIEDYINSYTNPSSNVRISYSDYMNRITTEFSTFVEVLTKVLVIFASISLLVSSIMIAVITYISVIERTKEIGIIRSLGARRIDVFRIFSAETLLIGLASGIVGIIGMYLLSSPINVLVKSIIADNTSLTTGLSTFNVVKIRSEYLLILILGSVVITLIAGVIPSIIASFSSPIKALNKD